MFVITGATGHTGAIVAEMLLAHGQRVRVLARDERKAAPWRAKGAEVALASLDDEPAVTRAFNGANGAYVLIPPQYGAGDLLAAQRSITDAVARAAQASRIPHVVLLSSVGAQHAEGTGPIRSLHYAERVIGQAARNVTMIRAAYFLENWAAVLPVAQTNGVLPSFLTPGRPVPMIATRDIGRVAAESLLERPQGTRVIELVGPADWTPEDVAQEIASVIGRAVGVQGLPLDAVVPTFTSSGMSLTTAKLFEEMISGLNRGHVAPEGGRTLLRFGTLRPGEALRPLLSHAAV